MFLLPSARSAIRRWRKLRSDSSRDTVERHPQIAFAPDGPEVRTPSGDPAAISRHYVSSVQPVDLTQRYTLQAVCDWYEAFLASGIIDGLPGLAYPLPTREKEVPGFPGFVRHTCTFEENCIRVHFLDAEGNDGGGLELCRAGHAWLIRAPNGTVFRARETDTFADVKTVGRPGEKRREPIQASERGGLF